jgi:dihydrolipoamide dehydrogenase
MVVGEFTVETDLVVIGGGPGGLSAATRAAELGIETTLVDDRPALGGAWLHAGCVLSKELCALADTIHAARHAASWGIEFGPPAIDLERMRSQLASRVDDQAAALDESCAAAGVQHVRGSARFDNSRQLSILNNPQTPRLRFRRAIIAAGSRSRCGPAADLDDPRVTGPDCALPLARLPQRLLVIGGSSVAVELAGIYASLGSRVTLVHEGDELVSLADRDLMTQLLDVLEPTLDDVRLGAPIPALTPGSDGVAADFGGGQSKTFDHVIVAIGREPNTDELNLEATQVQLDESGFVIVDEQMRTTDPRVLAIGDAVGEPMLAIKSVHQGRVAAETLAGWSSLHDPRAVPLILFTDPPLAWCGLTEAQAAASGQDFGVERTTWSASGQTSAVSHTGGLTKIIYEPETKLVLGMGIIGPGAPDLIAEGVVAIEMGAVLDDLAEMLHPHPGRAESLQRSLQATEDAPS